MSSVSMDCLTSLAAGRLGASSSISISLSESSSTPSSVSRNSARISSSDHLGSHRVAQALRSFLSKTPASGLKTEWVVSVTHSTLLLFTANASFLEAIPNCLRSYYIPSARQDCHSIRNGEFRR